MDLALALIERLLLRTELLHERPQVSGLLVSRQGLGNTISEVPGERAPDKLRWLEPVEDVGRREKLWARLISGDRAGRVLAP